MNLSLLPHPASPPAPLEAFDFEVSRRADRGLRLRYELRGDMRALRVPHPIARPGAADELWRHTCCELFIADAGAAYLEFNFAPSGQWAAYAFAGYRDRRDWRVDEAPRIQIESDEARLELHIELPPSLLPPCRPLHLSATAVVEDDRGELSYWALRHAAEKPDFHLRESFVLALA